MASTSYIGTVVSAEWDDSGPAPQYRITMTCDDGEQRVFRGSDRLNLFPVAGERIRIGAKDTPGAGDGAHKVMKLRDETDPDTQMLVQVERV